MIRRHWLTATGLAALLALVGCAGAVYAPLPTPPGVTAGVAFFWNDLAAYGTWLDLAPLGWVWLPAGVHPGWTPYTNGRWVLTDDGWTWISYWNWGWAPFHYGRWLRHPSHGWVWIPGDVWAPAWVTWRHGPGWVGWAPLPPAARWEAGSGLRWREHDLDRDAWSFVAEGSFVDPRLERHLAPPGRRPELLGTTRDVMLWNAPEPRQLSAGVAPDAISRATGRPVPRLRVEEMSRPPSRGRGAVDRERVRLFRPNPKTKSPKGPGPPHGAQGAPSR